MQFFEDMNDLRRLQKQLADQITRLEQVQRAFTVEVRETLARIETRLPPAMLTRRQAAALLHTTVRGVDCAIEAGRLKVVRVNGIKAVLIDATSIGSSVNIREEVEKLKAAIFTR